MTCCDKTKQIRIFRYYIILFEEMLYIFSICYMFLLDKKIFHINILNIYIKYKIYSYVFSYIISVYIKKSNL